MVVKPRRIEFHCGITMKSARFQLLRVHSMIISKKYIVIENEIQEDNSKIDETKVASKLGEIN